MSTYDIIKRKVNLAEIVSQNATLQKAGPTDYVCCCPFHNEKTPSFHLYAPDSDANYWNYFCYGCGRHGSVIDYIAERDKCSRTSAAYRLCGKYGIPTTDLATGKDKKGYVYIDPYPFYIARPYFEEQQKRDAWQSDFVLFLRTILSQDEIKNIMELYHLGVDNYHHVVFPQIDEHGLLRTAKRIKYMPNGHKVPKEQDQYNIKFITAKDVPEQYLFKHGENVKRDLFKTMQCLFGQHLLPMFPDKTVAVVESEKTACIMSQVMPEYLWIATGSKGELKPEKMMPLKDRRIILYPDADGYDKWCAEKDKLIYDYNFCKVSVSDVLQKLATEQQKKGKIDIADWVIMDLQGLPAPAQNTMTTETHETPDNIIDPSVSTVSTVSDVSDVLIGSTVMSVSLSQSETHETPVSDVPYYRRFKSYPPYHTIETVICNGRYNTLIDYKDPPQVFAKLDWMHGYPAWKQEEWINHYRHMVRTEDMPNAEVDFYKCIELFEYADKGKQLIRFVG